jgi:hypothetical protein
VTVHCITRHTHRGEITEIRRIRQRDHSPPSLRTPVPAHQSACCNRPVSREWLFDDGASKEKCTEICSRVSDKKNMSGCFLLLWEHLERGADQNPKHCHEPARPFWFENSVLVCAPISDRVLISREPRDWHELQRPRL